jgi:hypothetical protein
MKQKNCKEEEIEKKNALRKRGETRKCKELCKKREEK